MRLISRRKFSARRTAIWLCRFSRGDDQAALDQIERKLEIKRSGA
jgi:hypothetical protein